MEFMHITKYLLEKKGIKIYESLLETKKLGLIKKLSFNIYT